MRVGTLVVVAAELNPAVALQHGDAAAALGARDAQRVLQRAPLAREVGDGDAARAALVDAPDAAARLGDREQCLGGFGHVNALRKAPGRGSPRACQWAAGGSPALSLIHISEPTRLLSIS